jgi:hypothetical protein
MTPPDDPSNGVVLFRLTKLEESMTEMRTEMRGGFASLSFVNKEVYASERTSSQQYAEETRKIAEDARRVAWATAVFLIAALGAMLAVIRAVAG